MKPSLLTAVHYVGSKLLDQPDMADAFLSVFTQGRTFYEGDPARIWRERLIRYSKQRIKINNALLLSGTALAWNFFREQKTTKVFKVEGRHFSFDGLDLNAINDSAEGSAPVIGDPAYLASGNPSGMQVV